MNSNLLSISERDIKNNKNIYADCKKIDKIVKENTSVLKEKGFFSLVKKCFKNYRGFCKDDESIKHWMFLIH
jgi:hypothetical protein